MQNTLDKPYYIKFKVLIVLLAVLSMLFMVAFHTSSVLGNLSFEEILEWEPELPSLLDWVFIGMSFLPFLLLIIYVLICGNGKRATILLPVTLLLFASTVFLGHFIGFYESFKNYLLPELLENLEDLELALSRGKDFFPLLKDNWEYLKDDQFYGFSYELRIYFYSFASCLPMVVTLLLAAVSAFRGFKSKVCITMAATTALVYAFQLHMDLQQNGYLEYCWENGRFFYVIFYQSLILTIVTTAITLLLLGVKSNIKPVLGKSVAEDIFEEDDCIAAPEEFEECGAVAAAEEFEEAAAEMPAPIAEPAPAPEAAPAVEIDPVKELKLLKYKLELGLVSDEEYQAAQKALIDKL